MQAEEGQEEDSEEEPAEVADQHLANMATLQRMYNQLESEVPPSQGTFESTCLKLFGIQVRRRHFPPEEQQGEEPALVSEDELVTYVQWETEAAAAARALPLEMSEAVYNFAKIQEFSRRGRQGIWIPQLEKRKLYAAECASFLAYCTRELFEDWTVDDSLSNVWIAFISPTTKQEREERNQAIGRYILHRNSGRFLFSIHQKHPSNFKSVLSFIITG